MPGIKSDYATDGMCFKKYKYDYNLKKEHTNTNITLQFMHIKQPWLESNIADWSMMPFFRPKYSFSINL
jgi:hypothetical protein